MRWAYTSSVITDQSDAAAAAADDDDDDAPSLYYAYPGLGKRKQNGYKPAQDRGTCFSQT